VAQVSTGTRIRQWLMTGVSFMIPFVAGGGILIALSFMLGGYEIVFDDRLADGFQAGDIKEYAYVLFKIGGTAFGFLVPVLSGYIAFAIADRPGIAPGFVGGAISSAIGAGFLGGILTGFLAGFVALWISRWAVPNWIKPLMPVVIIPLIATTVTGAAMLLLLGAPIASLMTALTDALSGLGAAGLAVLGLVLGLMMAFDMGGPVNKVAYTFATTGLVAAGTAASAPEFQVMAIVMAAGMTPPLGLALATVLRKKAFSEAEQENGKAAWLLGATFITEGAIPFAAADPLRVIPSIMIGSGITGALVALFGNELRAPHGGFMVFGLTSNWYTYVLAIAIGTVITALLVLVAKGIGAKKA
jgi:fructose PTS system EIIBC or EIIC component